MSLQLQNRWRDNAHQYVRWSDVSREVIRLYKPRLQQQLVLSPRCGHLKGNGGVKAAVRFAQRLAWFNWLLYPATARPVPQPPFGTWHRWLANHEVFAAPGVPSTALLQRMLATINSYYGVFSHAHTYRLRKHIYQKELGPLKRFFLPDGASYQHLRIRKVWLQWRE